MVFALLTNVLAQESSSENTQNTWTYTYIRAIDNQEKELIEFLVANWFAMDSMAVKQGLFNDYKLIENNDKSPDRAWDLIVAVEYYTRGTYTDIQEEWQKIRSAHKTVLINGKNFPDLGKVIKTEELVFKEKH